MHSHIPYTRILILTLFFLFVVVSLGGIFFSARVYAQMGDMPCMPPTYAPIRALELVSRIPQSEPRELARGTFAENYTAIFLEGNEIICLASSPDGRGMLLVDDQLEFEVLHNDGSLGTWRHDFYDPVTRGITSTVPQDVSRLFARGLNSIRITLRDFFPNYYSSAPVWLIIWRGSTPTVAAMATPISISSPTALPTITQIYTSVPTITETVLFSKPTPNPQENIPALPQGPIIVPLVLAAFAFAFLLLAVRRSKINSSLLSKQLEPIRDRLQRGSEKEIKTYAKEIAKIYRRSSSNVTEQLKVLDELLEDYKKSAVFSIAVTEAAKEIMLLPWSTGLTPMEIFSYLTRKGMQWSE